MAADYLQQLERAPRGAGELPRTTVEEAREALARVRACLPPGDPLDTVLILLRAELARRQELL